MYLNLLDERVFLRSQLLSADALAFDFQPLRFRLPPLELVRQRHQPTLDVADVGRRFCFHDCKNKERKKKSTMQLICIRF